MSSNLPTPDPDSPADVVRAEVVAEIDTENLPVLPDFVDLDDDTQVWTRADVLWLLGITMLAAALRVVGLGDWSLWVDEAHSIRDATVPMSEFWNTNVSNYPISSVIVRVMIEQFRSFDPDWLRLPFAFAGILTVPLLAIVGRSMLGRRAAFAGAILLALSPWHIYWSQNVRGYSLLALFSVASIGMFWTGIQRRSWFAYLLSFLMLAAAGLTHPTAFAIGGVYIAAWLIMLWGKPGVYRTGVAVWSTLLGGGLLGVAYFVVQDQLNWFQAAKSSPSPIHFAQTVGFYFRLSILGAAGLALLALRHGRDRGAVIFVGLWMVLPILAVTALSLIAQTTAQYVFAAFPAACLLAGALCADLARRLEQSGVSSKSLRYALPLILIADLASYDLLYLTKQHGDRPRWAEAAERIQERSDTASSAVVLTTNEPSMMFYLHPDFYLGAARDAGRIEVHGIETWDIAAAGGGDNFFRDWQRLAFGDDRRLYVVVTEPELHEKEASRSGDQWLREHAQQILRLPGWSGPKDMTVLVYEIVPSRD